MVYEAREQRCSFRLTRSMTEKGPRGIRLEKDSVLLLQTEFRRPLVKPLAEVFRSALLIKRGKDLNKTFQIVQKITVVNMIHSLGKRFSLCAC